MFLPLPPHSKAEEKDIHRITHHVFTALYGHSPKNEQLLICRVHRELSRLHSTLATDGYAFVSGEHGSRLRFLRFLADALKPYAIEGNSVTMFFTVNQLKAPFTEQFTKQYLKAYQELDQALLTLFMLVRELAADIRECYPDEDHTRLIAVAKAFL